jgi:predicted nucleic acid-binding Zn ribbon protein
MGARSRRAEACEVAMNRINRIGRRTLIAMGIMLVIVIGVWLLK